MQRRAVFMLVELQAAIIAALCMVVVLQVRPVIAQSSAESSENAASANRRVLHFPTDRAMGVIYWRKTPANENDRLSMFGDEWRKVAEARGNVRLPTGGETRLDVNKAASTDMSSLGQLDPDALEGIGCRQTDLNDEGIAQLGRLTGLKMLDLRSVPITDAGIARLADLKKLRWLALDAFGTREKGFGPSDEAMKTIVQLPELEVLWLRHTKVTDAGLAELVNLKSVCDLAVSGAQVSDTGMKFLKQLPHLECLRLGLAGEKVGANITDDGLKTIGELTNLRVLELAGTKVTDPGLVNLQSLKLVKELTLDQTKVTEAGLEHLEPLESLKELRLYLGTPVTDIGAAHLAKIKSLRRILDDLEVTDKGVALLATLPNLEWIDLNGPGVTNEGVEYISQAKSLKWLEFQNCRITDAGLAALSDMPNLELMRVWRTHITGEGFKYLHGSPKLSHLGIDFGDRNSRPPDFQPTLEEVAKLEQIEWLEIGGEGLTSADLRSISQMRQLKKLQIEEGLSVDDDGMRCIASLANLTELRIDKGTVSDVGLKELAKLGGLQYLSINGTFTDSGLKSLVELKSLSGLYLNSPDITPEGIKTLEKQLPALQMGQ